MKSIQGRSYQQKTEKRWAFPMLRSRRANGGKLPYIRTRQSVCCHVGRSSTHLRSFSCICTEYRCQAIHQSPWKGERAAQCCMCGVVVEVVGIVMVVVGGSGVMVVVVVVVVVAVAVAAAAATTYFLISG